ncbi:MAG TPA: tail fiber domain-containing protein [Chitinophagaceae bacterium]|nr:tail fiber domain-containing protein [Chitinophagaceae bacterium]
MKKHSLLLLAVFSAIANLSAQIGKVGINTAIPQALLHVKDSSVLFSGVSGSLPGSPGNPPTSGAGVRMMWYPDKAAFRVGRVTGTDWDKDSIGMYSFASGYNTKAKGSGSNALGSGINASGYYSTAMGLNSTASGGYSVAIGVSTTASGSSSIAMGWATNASGDNSTAVGAGANASGEYSIAMGYNTIASGESSTAMGYYTNSTTYSSTAMGSFTNASGSYTTAMGFYNTARAYASVALGRYNDSITGSSPTSWVSTDPVFIIGNGTSSVARSNAITVLKNSNTGINTTSPGARLHIVKSGVSGGSFLSNASMIIEDNVNSYLHLSQPNNSEAGILSGNASTTIRNGIVFRADSSIQFWAGGNYTRMTLDKNGNLDIDGVYSSSDMRLKKNISALQNSLQKILRLNGYHYNWIDRSRSSVLQTGVLAQEIEQEMPELVKTDEEGVKSVNYSGMIPYLIEAVKELKQENDQLKMELMQLKSFIKEIAGNKK